MNREQWIEAFARELGLNPPTEDQIEAILELAAIAAHTSERTAAPVATWLAGSSGRPLSEANQIAGRISDVASGRRRTFPGHGLRSSTLERTWASARVGLLVDAAG